MSFQTGTEEITIRITRDKSLTGDTLLGKFECNGFVGHTLEDNSLKLKDGQYRGKIYFSPKFRRNVISLNDNDTKRKSIQIHHGNYVKNSGGSILVGNGRGYDPDNNKNGAVWKSVDTLKALIAKCGKKNIKIIIETEGKRMTKITNNNDDEKKSVDNNMDDGIYIDRVFVIRCKVQSFLPDNFKIGGLSHSALLLAVKNNENKYYVLEYSDDKRTQLYPVKFAIIKTYNDKYYQEIKLNGVKWTKQLNGSQPIKPWTIQKAKKVIDDAFKDEYAISKNKCCHIAQQIVRKAMGLSVDKAFDINNYPKIIKKGFSFAGY